MMAIPRETAKTCTLLHQHPVPERAREARVVRAENTHKHIHTHTHQRIAKIQTLRSRVHATAILQYIMKWTKLKIRNQTDE